VIFPKDPDFPVFVPIQCKTKKPYPLEWWFRATTSSSLRETFIPYASIWFLKGIKTLEFPTPSTKNVVHIFTKGRFGMVEVGHAPTFTWGYYKFVGIKEDLHIHCVISISIAAFVNVIIVDAGKVQILNDLINSLPTRIHIHINLLYKLLLYIKNSSDTSLKKFRKLLVVHFYQMNESLK